MYNNSLLINDGYDDLRLRIERYGGMEKFWSFVLKLPNRPLYLARPNIKYQNSFRRGTSFHPCSLRSSSRRMSLIGRVMWIGSISHSGTALRGLPGRPWRARVSVV